MTETDWKFTAEARLQRIKELEAERDMLFDQFTKHTVEASARLAAAERERDEANMHMRFARESSDIWRERYYKALPRNAVKEIH